MPIIVDMELRKLLELYDMALFASSHNKDSSLGKTTNMSLLKGIIKDGWKETVYERKEFWAISVERNESITEKSIPILEEEFNEFLKDLKDAFGDNVDSVDTANKAGTYFIVFLKKGNPDRDWSDKDEQELNDLYKKYDI